VPAGREAQGPSSSINLQTLVVMQSHNNIATKVHYVCVVVLSLMVASWLVGCDSSEVDAPQGHGVERVVISPSTASVAVGDEVSFSAFALTAQGDTVDTADLDIEWRWWSSSPSVFTVEDDGTATAHSPGEEYCVVEATILRGLPNFTGRDSAFVMVF
jgi:hypothetical protein